MRNDTKITVRVFGCVLIMGVASFLFSCSSAPKNPGDIYDLRNRAETLLERGNRQADRGDSAAALISLDEAMRVAVATDDPGLRIRVGLSRGNVFFSEGQREKAAQEWDEALREAEQAGNTELAAVSRTHIARGKLLTSADTAQSVRDEVSRDIVLIKTDRFYIAFAWTIIGFAEKELGNYAAAEAAVRRSLEIHEKDRYFELAAYDWFVIASCRSLSGDFTGALQALEAAIGYDRRIENSWGLANDWRAMGDVHKKAGNREASRSAYLRAAEIFRALDNEESAEEALSRIDR